MLRTRGDSCPRPRRRHSVWPPRCRTRSSTWRNRCRATMTWSASNDGEPLLTLLIHCLYIVFWHPFYLATIFKNRTKNGIFTVFTIHFKYCLNYRCKIDQHCGIYIYDICKSFVKWLFLLSTIYIDNSYLKIWFSIPLQKGNFWNQMNHALAVLCPSC